MKKQFECRWKRCKNRITHHTWGYMKIYRGDKSPFHGPKGLTFPHFSANNSVHSQECCNRMQNNSAHSKSAIKMAIQREGTPRKSHNSDFHRKAVCITWVWVIFEAIPLPMCGSQVWSLAVHETIMQLIHSGMLVASSTRFATGFIHKKHVFSWTKKKTIHKTPHNGLVGVCKGVFLRGT